MTAKTVLHLALAAVLLLVVALVQVVKSVNVDQYRPLIAAWVQQEIGRKVSFSGPLTLKLGMRPAVVADGVTLANSPGRSPSEMVTLDHVEAEIGLFPLLSGEVRISRLWIDGAALFLETDGHGHGNWEFAAVGAAAASPAELPATVVRITQLLFDRVTVHWRDGADRTLQIDHATLDSDGPTMPMGLAAEGKWQDRPLRIDGELSSLKDMASKEKPLSLHLKALMPGCVTTLDGTVRNDPHQGLTLGLLVTADLADSTDLNPLLGLPLPPLGAARAAFTLGGPIYHPEARDIDATIGRHDVLAISVKGTIEDLLAGAGVTLTMAVTGDVGASLGHPADSMPLAFTGHVSSIGIGGDRVWRIGDFRGGIGRSDIAGQITWHHRDGHPLIEGSFDSMLVDLSRPVEPSAVPATTLFPDGRIFSDAALPMAVLAESDGHLSWHVAHLIDRGLDSSGASLAVDWQDGKLAAKGAVANLAGGNAAGSLTIDSSAQPAVISVDLTMAHLSAGDFLSGLGWSDAVQGGRVDLQFKSSGRGQSLRGIMASQQGSSLLVLGPTQFSGSLTHDGLGSVLSQVIPSSGDQPSDLRCLISRFTLADGLARSEALLFVVGAVTVTGQGSINLASEALDFTLSPRQIGPAPAAPLDVSGTLLHPAVTPDKGAIVKNLPGITGDATGPLMVFANSETSPCFSALSQGKKRPPAGVPR